MISANALERRLKRRVRRVEHRYAAICSPGFERELLGELIEFLGITNYQIIPGGVEFSGSLDLVYIANLQLRTAHRVLLRIKQFKALTFPMLFDQLSRVEWELWVPNKGSFRARVATRNSKLNMKARIVDTCREAIVARLGSNGLSAQFDPGSEFEFLLRLHENTATLSFNTSGVHLHKRGYKQSTVDAPIRETIAAGILRRVNYRSFNFVVDPFCGSGTLVLEAAQMDSKIAPGSARYFAFMHAPWFEERKWLSLAEKTRNRTTVASTRSYLCSDVSKDAVSATKRNAQRAGVDDLLTIFRSDYREINYRELSGGTNLLVTNPPYGKRLKAVDAPKEPLFDAIASQLAGWTLAYVKPKSAQVYLSDRYLLKSEVVSFSNGGIQSELHIIRLPTKDNK